MIYLHLNYKERPPRSSLIEVHHRVPRAARGPTFYSPSTCHPLNLSLRTVIYNFGEDYGIAELLNLKARMPTPDDKPALNILVLRDPLNLLASRVEKIQAHGRARHDWSAFHRALPGMVQGRGGGRTASQECDRGELQPLGHLEDILCKSGGAGRDGDSFLRVPREEYVVLGLDRS